MSEVTFGSAAPFHALKKARPLSTFQDLLVRDGRRITEWYVKTFGVTLDKA
jgi:hypothetical protein